MSRAAWSRPDRSRPTPHRETSLSIAATVVSLRQAFANPSQRWTICAIRIQAKPAQRNNFRGDGYFGVDAGLSKSWKIREGNGIRFAWEVFNVTNSVRFDVNPLTSLAEHDDQRRVRRLWRNSYPAACAAVFSPLFILEAAECIKSCTRQCSQYAEYRIAHCSKDKVDSVGCYDD